MIDKLIEQIEKSESIDAYQYLDENIIEIDEGKELELDDFHILYNLYVNISIANVKTPYNQPPEITLLHDHVEITDIEVLDIEQQREIELTDNQYAEIQEILKSKVEY